MTARPWSLLPAAPLRSADKSNPMKGITQAMHGQRARPVPPLPPQDPYFRPFFFTGEEYRDVSALVDAILPATNTPGALAARADEYADLMIWQQEQHAAVRRQLTRFREICSQRYGKPFAQLTAAQAVEFLTRLTGKSLEEAERPAAQFFNRRAASSKFQVGAATDCSRAVYRPGAGNSSRPAKKQRFSSTGILACAAAPSARPWSFYILPQAQEHRGGGPPHEPYPSEEM